MGDRDEGFEPAFRLRSPLTRAMYNRINNDERHRESNHTFWYKVNKASLSEELCLKFHQSHQDEGTTKFLENCFEKSDWLFTQIWQSLVKSVLTWFMTVTSVNGYLGRGSMFVFSKQQFNTLMKIGPDWTADNLLDLGAGDGVVTENFAGHFKNVYTTEVSQPMVDRLKSRGYEVLGIEEWNENSVAYDVITCLNVLDRCDHPVTMLMDMLRVLKPDGRIIIAVVLPFSPYVEKGSNGNKPSENLPISGNTFEEQASSIVRDVFQPAGLELVSFTRLPYLCEGDINHSFYILNDAVFVLKPLFGS
ncbi:protein-L-histidine N-pros-methyltransferase-like isoform X2 [Lineus longissimus]